MERNKFIFYKDWWEALRQMPEEMSRSIIEAIMNYALYGIDTDNPQIAYSIYALAKAQIDRDTSKYDKQAERNRINGAKSKGAPIGNQNARKQPKQPTGLNSTQDNPNNPNNPKQPNNIDIDINIDNNDIEEKNKEKKNVKRFVAPTEDEVQQYILEKGLTHVNAAQFVAYYESNGWMVGRNKMKSWKAACRTWNSNNYGNGRNNINRQSYNGAATTKEQRDAEFAAHIARKLAGGAPMY